MSTSTKIFRNTLWTRRSYECTNIVACEAETAPGPQWVECGPEILEGLKPLHRQGGARYWGHL